MQNLKILGKSFLIYLITIFLFILLLNTFYYFNLLSLKTLSFLLFGIQLIVLLFISITLGKKATKRGFLEGLKLGGIILFFYFLLYVLGFNGNLSLKLVIYYFILLLTSILGSMIGINKKA